MDRRRFLHLSAATTFAAAPLVVRAAHATSQDALLARRWWDAAAKVRSRWYDVVTDLPAEQAEALVGHMDSMVDAYLEMFSSFRISKRFRLELWAFRAAEDYHRVLGHQLSASVPGSQGVCVTRGTRIVLAGWQGGTDPERLVRVFQHEGFHQFASAMFPGLPTWANEGTAEVFEAAPIVQGRVMVGDVPRGSLERLLDASRRRTLRPFESFVSMNQGTWNGHVAGGGAGMNYTQAWSMVHFLLYAEGGAFQSRYLQFLGHMNQGQSSDSAWSRVFGRTFVEWQRRYLDYLHGLRPTDLRVTADRLEFLAAGARTLTEAGTRPATLAVLRDGLRARGFEHEVVDGRHRATVSAAKDESFLVPGGDDSGVGPRFVLRDSPGVPKAKRDAVPPSIETVDLFPRRMGVAFAWQRGVVAARFVTD